MPPKGQKNGGETSKKAITAKQQQLKPPEPNFFRPSPRSSFPPSLKSAKSKVVSTLMQRPRRSCTVGLLASALGPVTDERQPRPKSPKKTSKEPQLITPLVQTSRLEESLLDHRIATDRVSVIEAWVAGVEGNPSRQPSIQSTPVAPEPEESFWKRRGYDIPDSPICSTSSSMNQSQSNASKARGTSTSRRRKSQNTNFLGVSVIKAKDGKFSTCLMEHNITLDPEEIPDENLSDIKKLVLKRLPRSRTIGDGDKSTALETRWQRDMTKCKVSNEAIFQRTIMMEILERYELHENLDFTCEEPWCAERMPGRDRTVRLAQPKPDLAVAFKSTSLLPKNCSLPGLLRLGKTASHVFAEGQKKGQIDRAFHFFSVEVKGKRGDLANSEAEFQNLNTASQALHNMYVFMREAGLEYEFFEEVRFFSVVATAACFELRVHRPVRLDPSEYIVPGYVAGFRFNDILKFEGDYKRSMASKIVYNILFNYGVAKLHPILKSALAKILKRNPGSASGAGPSDEGTPGARQPKQPISKRPGDEESVESFSSSKRIKTGRQDVSESDGKIAT